MNRHPLPRWKHGHCPKVKASKAYRAWASMKSRCLYRKNASYSNYGGRSIMVCDRWKNSFENFLADMGEPPTENHTLDRFPNNDGNYEPENCRWATKIEQGHQRTNRLITIGGEQLRLVQWSRRSGVGPRTIAHRLKIGVPPQQAVFTPAIHGANSLF